MQAERRRSNYPAPDKILEKNIKYFYKNGEIDLPENFNGLGYSNLIYLVLKIVSFVEKFKKAKKEGLAIIKAVYKLDTGEVKRLE